VKIRARTALLGVAAGTAAGALTLLVLFRKEGEPLTAGGLDAAEARWREAGPRDYDLAVSVRGAQSGEHRIEVRGGRVVAMTTGGAPVDPRVWPYWSVEGLFRFLRDELGARDRAREAHDAEGSAQVVLRVAFDGKLGYPRRFLRHVLGGRPGIEWEVTGLVPR
jgi:hypothetical protein